MKYDTYSILEPIDKFIEDKSANIKNVYFGKLDYTLKGVTYREYLDFFMDVIDDAEYKAFDDDTAIYNDKMVVTLRHIFMTKKERIEAPYILLRGDVDLIADIKKAFIEHFKDKIKPASTNVEWVFETREGLSTVTMPRKEVAELNQAMYPFIPDVKQLIKDFAASKENVLILTGEPGTGKSTLINHIIAEVNGMTQVVYDHELMMNDGLYVSFIREVGQREVKGMMVLEDADIVLSARIDNQNPTMAKLLNISDGVIDSTMLKFVFTANIDSVDEIDDALTRPGRCFSVIEFRPLTYTEALEVAKIVGTELAEERSYTLAEIYNGRRQPKRVKPTKVGF